MVTTSSTAPVAVMTAGYRATRRRGFDIRSNTATIPTSLCLRARSGPPPKLFQFLGFGARSEREAERQLGKSVDACDGVERGLAVELQTAHALCEERQRLAQLQTREVG